MHLLIPLVLLAAVVLALAVCLTRTKQRAAAVAEKGPPNTPVAPKSEAGEPYATVSKNFQPSNHHEVISWTDTGSDSSSIGHVSLSSLTVSASDTSGSLIDYIGEEPMDGFGNDFHIGCADSDTRLSDLTGTGGTGSALDQCVSNTDFTDSTISQENASSSTLDEMGM